jgi:hypothetical protein
MAMKPTSLVVKMAIPQSLHSDHWTVERFGFETRHANLSMQPGNLHARKGNTNPLGCQKSCMM